MNIFKIITLILCDHARLIRHKLKTEVVFINKTTMLELKGFILAGIGTYSVS